MKFCVTAETNLKKACRATFKFTYDTFLCLGFYKIRKGILVKSKYFRCLSYKFSSIITMLHIVDIFTFLIIGLNYNYWKVTINTLYIFLVNKSVHNIIYTK